MQFEVTWSSAAYRDLGRITEYLGGRNPAAALRMAEALIAAGDSLATFPRRGRPGRAKGTRELVIVRPYILVYEVGERSATILRIWHSAQNRPR
jgi:addiction module RelE/StbE family toxin